MKIKTSELEGVALDWAVNVCENPALALGAFNYAGERVAHAAGVGWSQAGSFIDRECLSITYWGERSRFGQTPSPEQFWEARHPSHRTHSFRTAGFGITALIAVKRCYVASKLGEEVEIPDELINN
jgi:hypothetical protein